MAAQARVLVVDDEPMVRDVLARYLKRSGFEVDSAPDGELALAAFEAHRPDLVLLDLMLPRVDGFEVFRRIRARSQSPVIMITARGQTTDRIVGLEVGADDYISKPFSPRELVARMKAVLRRTEEQAEHDSLVLGDVILEPDAREVTVAGRRVELTGKEFDLLAWLLEHPGIVFSRDHLLDRVWGMSYAGGTRTVDVHVAQVRRKLGRPDLIRTIRGSGYKAVSP
jgi:DNA-binding response OmpR family regulator